jgi:hypothetical protein
MLCIKKPVQNATNHRSAAVIPAHGPAQPVTIILHRSLLKMQRLANKATHDYSLLKTMTFKKTHN